MIYKFTGTQTAAAKTALGVQATTAIRPRILGYVTSNGGVVSTDSGFEVQIKRSTTAGTSTALTLNGVDSGDPTATVVGGSNFTAEPTYTANTLLDDVFVNPRSTYRWVAYEQRDELVAPATAANGFGFFINALGGATTIVCTATVMQ
jgi:hypothetical protein